MKSYFATERRLARQWSNPTRAAALAHLRWLLRGRMGVYSAMELVKLCHSGHLKEQAMLQEIKEMQNDFDWKPEETDPGPWFNRYCARWRNAA